MLRVLPLLAALILLLAPASQARLVSAPPASIAPPSTSENASTAFLEGGSESRIGLLCGNDPLDKTDPMGLTDIPTTHEEDLAGRDAAVNSFNHARQMVQRGIDKSLQDYGQGVRTTNGKRQASGEFYKETSSTERKFESLRMKTYPSKREEIKTYAKPGEAGSVGHVHHDVSGQPASGSGPSSTDDQASRSTRVYRLNESNQNVIYRAVPQVEGTAPVDKPFDRKTMEPLDPKTLKLRGQ